MADSSRGTGPAVAKLREIVRKANENRDQYQARLVATIEERDALAEQLAGAVSAVDDAHQVILDALASLHPEPAKRLMETESYKRFKLHLQGRT